MTFEQMERAMEFMLEQQARSLERHARTDALLDKIGLRLDILAADAVTFDARMDKLHDEIASVRDVAISHNQAIHQLFKLNEQTQQKFERLHEQRKDEFELNQQNFEILNEQREREIETTRKKFELMDEQRQEDLEATRQKSEAADKQRQEDLEATRKKFEIADEQREKEVKATLDLIKQLTHKIDSLADALSKPGQNGRQ